MMKSVESPVKFSDVDQALNAENQLAYSSAILNVGEDVREDNSAGFAALCPP